MERDEVVEALETEDRGNVSTRQGASGDGRAKGKGRERGAA